MSDRAAGLRDPGQIASAVSMRGDLGREAQRLFEQQLKEWPMLSRGHAGMRASMVREIECDGFSVWLQFNPQRIVSTGANVNPAAIQARPCFLCASNLPPEQRGVLVDDTWVILCNPSPILDRHFTVPRLDHLPQELDPHLSSMLDLAEGFGPGFTVFYNGPKCGASAPDHMHFQACPAGLIPVEAAALRAEHRSVKASRGDATVIFLERYGRESVVIESPHRESAKETFRRLMGAAQEVLGLAEEPLVNVIVRRAPDVWRIIVFLRSRHRPASFSLEGDDKVTVSPAAVDIGGLVVTPLERDFRRLDAHRITAIFSEVSLDHAQTERILEAL